MASQFKYYNAIDYVILIWLWILAKNIPICQKPHI